MTGADRIHHGHARWPRAAVLVLACAMVLASACRGAAPPNSNRWRIALSPKSFGQTISLQQHVQVEQSGRTIDFEAVLDVTPDTLTLVGIAFNQRVFTLKYDGVKLQESRSRMLPKEVQAGDVLSDLQLALWPFEALKTALPNGTTIIDSEPQRTLSRGDTLIAVINYSTQPRWLGTITIENKEYNYRLVIKSAVSN